MTAPGSGEGDFKMAGAYVELSIKDDNLESEVEAAKKKVEDTTPAEIPTKFGPPEGDPREDAEKKFGAEPPVEVPTSATNPIDAAWLSRLNASLKSIAGDAVSIPATPETEAYRSELRAALDEIASVTVQDIPVEVADADAYRARIEQLVGTVSKEVQARLLVAVDQASMDKTAEQIEAEAKAIGDAAQVKLKVSEDTGGAAAGGVGGIGTFGAIAGASVVAAPAIGGLAIAAVPAILTAIGIEAEKSNSEVQQSFAGMEAAAKSTLTDGFQPFVPTLTEIGHEGAAAVEELEPALHSAAGAAAPLLQTVSTDLIRAVQQGVGQSAPLLQQMGPIATTIGDDFEKGEQGVIGFFQAMNVEDAARGIGLLGTDVEDILPAIGSLVTTVAPAANAFLGFLGPAVKDTATEFSILRPIVQAVGAVIQYVTPAAAFLVPPLLAAAAGAKLLTGSWTDFSGAGSKVLSLFTNTDTALTAIANKLGITTAAQNTQTKTDLTAAAAKAQLIADADAEAAVNAKLALVTDQSAAAKLASAEADDTAAASAAAAATAETALAGASEEAEFAMGPLGIALGVIGLALAPLAINADKTSSSTTNLAGSLQKLEQAASDQQSLANLFQTDPQAEQQLQLLQKYGVTLKDLADANSGDAAAQEKVAAAAKEAMDATNQKTSADEAQLNALKNSGSAVEANRLNSSGLTAETKKATDAVNADNTAQASATAIYNDATNQVSANAAARSASTQATQLNTQQQQAANAAAQALGLSTDSMTNAFEHLIAANPKDSVSQLTQAFVADQVAVDSAVTAISTGFQQADQAVTQAHQSLDNANYSYQQSLQGVTSAQHSYVEAQQGVVTAEQGVANAQQQLQQALEGVATAEQNLTKAETSDQQALVSLNQARQQAAEDLKALQLQLNDQVASEESAQLKLFQQTATSASAGVTAANAQQIASQDATTANQNQIQAALDLIDAENSLADTLNTGANLRQQVAQAEQEGVDGAPGVVSAQQALQNAQDQVTSSAQALTKAQQGVVSAQAGVVAAEQGVQNALYNEQQADLAVVDAEHNVQQAAEAVTAAKQALAAAEENASRQLDLTTAAGQRNYGMLSSLAQSLNNLYGPQEANNQLIQDTADKFGISAGAAQTMLDKLGLLTSTPYSFDVKAVASVDLGSLENQLHISGTNINLKKDGGPITGPGGPRDDLVPTMLSNGEYVVNAASTARNFGLLESINSNKMADGGLVAANVGIGALGINYQDGIDAMDVIGMPHPPGLPAYVAPTVSGGLASVPASRAANEAAVQAVFSQYGWGSGPEWNAATQLIMMESGFNNVAQNPTSTAYGIFQFLNSTWGGYGISKTSDPTTQAVGGARYIAARYGDPINALSHEHAYHWYEDGGYLMPGATMAANGTGQKEMVLPPSMSDTLERVDRAVQSRGGPGGSNNFYITQQRGESGAQLAMRVSATTKFASQSGRK